MASYPQYLRFAPKKPLAWVEVPPFVIAPRVTTVRPPVPQTGRPASGPVPSTRRLAGWSQSTSAGTSSQRTFAPRPAPPRYVRMSAGDQGSPHARPASRSTRRSCPAYPPGRSALADTAPFVATCVIESLLAGMGSDFDFGTFRTPALIRPRLPDSRAQILGPRAALAPGEMSVSQSLTPSSSTPRR